MVERGDRPAAPGLSIVLVSFETRDLLEASLRAVAAEGGGSVETWVVDNASTDGSADMVAEAFPSVRLLRHDRNVGFAAGNNAALRHVTGDLILLLNSDAVLLPGSLDALREVFAREPSVGICGPRLLNPDGSLQPSWGRRPTPVTELLFQSFLYKVWPCRFPYGRRPHPLLRPAYARFRRVDWVSGAALMLRRSVLERIGGLPEDTFMYGEDLEYCLRAAEAGFEVAYEPRALVRHHVAGSRRDHAGWIEAYTRATLEHYRRRGTRQELAAAARYIRWGSGLRRAVWGVLGLLPSRRAEAEARRAGYQRAALLARRYVAGPPPPSPGG